MARQAVSDKGGDFAPEAADRHAGDGPSTHFGIYRRDFPCLNLITMNFLKLATVVFILGFLQFGKSAEAEYDLEKIVTTSGKIYREILILGADDYGLTFRHRGGIAKERFSSLSANLRMLYEIVDDPMVEEKVAEVPVKTEAEPVPSSRALPPMVVTMRTRVHIVHPALQLGGGYGSPDASQWPSWWARYYPIHHLTNPYQRELAVRDFLYSSGLLPTPCGIRTYRLPGRYGY